MCLGSIRAPWAHHSRAPQLQNLTSSASFHPLSAQMPFVSSQQSRSASIPGTGLALSCTGDSFRISFCAPHSVCPLQPGFSPISLLCVCLVPQRSRVPARGPRCHSEQGTPVARGALDQGHCCSHSDLTHLPCPVLGVSSELLAPWAHGELRGAGQAGFSSSSCSGAALPSHTQLMPAETGLLSPNQQTPRAPEEALAGDSSAGTVLC